MRSHLTAANGDPSTVSSASASTARAELHPPVLAASSGLVRLGAACFGAPPVTLPAAQLALLLGRGDVLVDEHGESGPSAGLLWQSHGGGAGTDANAAPALVVTRPGCYRVLCCLDSGGARRAARGFAGDAGGASGRGSSGSGASAAAAALLGAATPAPGAGGAAGGAAGGSAGYRQKQAIRAAQYICAIAGLVIVNLILLYDVAGRGSNVKDFLINFASDISALGAVLLTAEAVDVVGRRVPRATGSARPVLGRRGRDEDEDDDADGAEFDLYARPVTAVNS